MSRGTKLQRMEEDVTQSKTAVNANAAAGDMALPKEGSNPSGVSTPGNTPPFEDLGGPTPENYKVDNDSAKLKTPGGSLKQVRDVVNKGAKPGDQAMPTAKKFKEEEEIQGDVVAEDEVTTDEVVEEINIEDDVNALLGGEELSEEFQSKARTIFEAALRSKVSEVKEAMTKNFEETYESKLVEEVDAIRGSITERIDSYLEYVADEWVQENQLAVESGLKAEMTESFLSGMKKLFEDHYVQIPEDKYLSLIHI